MEGLFSVQSAGQRLISPSLYQCIGSVSIRRSVSGFSMDTRISSRSPSQFTIRSQQVKIAQAYERGGTAFLSVLTDQNIAYCCYIDCLEITFLLKFSNKLGLAALVEVLVGESIVKQNDPEKGIAGLFGMNISHT